MKWPWTRRRHGPSEDAQAANQQAHRALEDAEAQHERAKEVADMLRKTTQRNHFAEAVIASIRGHHR